MENVPWHEEVIKFAEKLVAMLPDYAIASEHEHSNCILIAHNKVIITITIYILFIFLIINYKLHYANFFLQVWFCFVSYIFIKSHFYKYLKNNV